MVNDLPPVFYITCFPLSGILVARGKVTPKRAVATKYDLSSGCRTTFWHSEYAEDLEAARADVARRLSCSIDIKRQELAALEKALFENEFIDAAKMAKKIQAYDEKTR